MSDSEYSSLAPSVSTLERIDREIVESSVRLHRFFVSSFRAGDIAVPLPAFDENTPDNRILEIMNRCKFQAAGVTRDGFVRGVLVASGPTEAVTQFVRRRLQDVAIVDSDASLTVVVEKLAQTTPLFVSSFGRVAGLVDRGCLQKPPGRMWLFGIITLLEMRAAVAVDLLYPEESWHAVISLGRLEKATALRDERMRRGQTCSLLDCLQLTDKTDLLQRSEKYVELFGTTPKRQFKDAIKGIESLRNNLAHAQDFIPQDWPVVMMLIATLEERLLHPKLQQLTTYRSPRHPRA